MMKEFRDFAFKGNVIDLAVGVVIGAAFGKIVAGMVDDIIMPIVSLAMPSGEWREAALTLRELPPEGPQGDVSLKLGHLASVFVDFLIVALVLFLVVRVVQRMRAQNQPAPEPPHRECPHCLESIPKKASKCRACASTVEPILNSSH